MPVQLGFLWIKQSCASSVDSQSSSLLTSFLELSPLNFHNITILLLCLSPLTTLLGSFTSSFSSSHSLKVQISQRLQGEVGTKPSPDKPFQILPNVNRTQLEVLSMALKASWSCDSLCLSANSQLQTNLYPSPLNTFTQCHNAQLSPTLFPAPSDCPLNDPIQILPTLQHFPKVFLNCPT